MVQINEISPSRFRSGDLITIRGFGFAPTFGDNAVAVAGIPEPLQSETATEITLFVPPGIPENEYVSVYVFRGDTLGNDSTQAFSKASAGDLLTGVVRVPGQIPGDTEANDPIRVEDVPQAQDYERLVTAIEHLLFNVLATKGDLFAFDGAALVPHPVGATLEHRLGANPAPSTGMEYVAVARAQSLRWAGRKLAAVVTVDAIVANGESDKTSVVNGLHLAPLTGNVYRVAVLFAAGTAGDTLDQVIVRINGALSYDSGTGLGVTPGNAHTAGLALAVTVADTIELEVKKLGTLGDGDFVGQVGVR